MQSNPANTPAVADRKLRHDPYSLSYGVFGFGPVVVEPRVHISKKAEREKVKMEEKAAVERFISDIFAANDRSCPDSEAAADHAMRLDSRAVALNDGVYTHPVDGRRISLEGLGFIFIGMPARAMPNSQGNGSTAVDCAGELDPNEPYVATLALGQVGYHTTAQQLRDFLNTVMGHLRDEPAPVLLVSEGDRKSRRTGVWFVTVRPTRAKDLLSLHHRVVFGESGAYVSPSAEHAAQQWGNVLEFVALRNCYAQRVKASVPGVHEKFKTGSFLMTVEEPRKLKA